MNSTLIGKSRCITFMLGSVFSSLLTYQGRIILWYANDVRISTGKIQEQVNMNLFFTMSCRGSLYVTLHPIPVLVVDSIPQVGPDMLMTGFLQPIPSCQPDVPAAAAIDQSIPSSVQRPQVITFYKPWDPYGALSNFSPHPISLPDESGTIVLWNSVEHYYQVIIAFNVNCVIRPWINWLMRYI